jgi:hypothetical protein
VAALLGDQEAYLEFRRIVRELFPEAWDEVMNAREAGADREAARVWALCRHVEANYFPLYEAEAYEQVAYEIPIVHQGWSIDRLHELDMPFGELLLACLCGDPYLFDAGIRVSMLDAAERRVPRDLLVQIPGDGLAPAELHARLEGTPYAAAADFADWIFHDTGFVFLDCDDEEVVSIEWTREHVLELTDQWRQANDLLGRVGELTRWLEQDPPAHFALLLDAVVGGEAHADYQRERQHYACEITEAGLVPVPRDDPGVTVPPGPAG